MRIIGGNLKGKRISAPGNLPVRPTTDFAKESLFNILNHQLSFEQVVLLDLFAGTGNISYEFASRGAQEIVCMDLNYNCVKFINQTAKNLDLNIRAQRMDVMRLLKKASRKSYPLVYADPPYKLNDLEKIPDYILKNGWLTEGGLFILEHGPEHNFEEHENLIEFRKYGHVHFSFFQ